MGLDLSRLCVLVVDDNAYMRLIIKEILRSLGVGAIREAVDGADALKLMRVLPADIVIADLDMNPLDGLEMARLLRTSKDSPNPFVPIIMLTGHTEAHRVAEARDAGVNEFLAKPISVRGLYSRIREVVQRPRLFVRAKHYVGPDRRRRDADPGKLGFPDRRRATTPSLDQTPEATSKQPG
ncbi:response regulator [uncultured Rhodospira sp.]|uniref:response regulator n=1 Tax=uncultured Rhodospira sp. TaxID=1936189 RepID=UPI002614863E|nr:response regulator [uncultured Rhodospira sp.]